VSIYATWLHLDDTHTDECAIWVETSDGCFEPIGGPCDCGIPMCPLVYEGSHILPSDDDQRGGSVDVAGIPDFITRDGRDDAQGTGLKDWLRLSVGALPSKLIYKGRPYQLGGYVAVVLTRPQVEMMRDTLTAWLEREETA
jgi:hypothetical protein